MSYICNFVALYNLFYAVEHGGVCMKTVAEAIVGGTYA